MKIFRFAMGFGAMLWTSMISSSYAETVEVRVGEPTPNDDFICWNPHIAFARLQNSDSAKSITVSALSQAGGGMVEFGAFTGSVPAAANYNPQSSLDLTLPSDGSWVRFLVSGSKASAGSKDVTIVATNGGQRLSEPLPVMVRVRKDAARLNDTERRIFLETLAILHNLPSMRTSQYAKYSDAHSEAFSEGIHDNRSGFSRPLFLAWHRAYLLSLERELQAINPNVTLPYWRFDRPDETANGRRKIFVPEFVGANDLTPNRVGAFVVRFNRTNPIARWRARGNGAFTRMSHVAGAPIPPSNFSALFSSRRVNYQNVNSYIEWSYHNRAHGARFAWLGTGSSPRDPLFFLLHANTDRAWAHWQARSVERFDHSKPIAYHAQGSYPGSSVPGGPIHRKGAYLNDTMWPWNGAFGDNGTPDLNDDWPVVPAFPQNLLTGIASSAPTPADMLDYMNVLGTNVSHDVCYDDINFKGAPISQ